MTRVYFASVEALNDDELFARCRAQLSAGRLAKAERMRFRKDQNLSIGAGLLLKKGLQAYGLREKDMLYETGANGKPFFAAAPEICFNVSHSGQMVMAAFSDVPVGCDIEKISDVNLAIAERFFCKSEAASVLAMKTDAEKQKQFYRYWTLKESFLKATGLGLSIRPDAFELMLLPGEVTVLHTVNDEKYSFREFNAVAGYCSALCVQAPSCEATCTFTTPEECLP